MAGGKLRKPPVALTVAGLDPSGGAGIAADLRAFARLRLYGAAVVTAVTVQNTVGVKGVVPLAAGLVKDQLAAVLEDLPVAAIKVGMVGGEAVAKAVAATLRRLAPTVPVVVDPVLWASAGGPPLSGPQGAKALRPLLACCTVLTPNLAEAQALAELAVGAPARRLAALALGRHLLAAGPAAVVITSALPGPAGGDLFIEEGRVAQLRGRRTVAGQAHGSGCTHSALLAGFLALGLPPLLAARRARALTARAVEHRLALGKGVGPADLLGLGRG